MIPELGHFCLVLAGVFSLAQAVMGFYGANRVNPRCIDSANGFALGQFIALLLAFLTLVICFARSDFSLVVVANNSHSTLPLAYRIAGSWGNHEGSMLLWCLMLALFGALIAVFGRGLPSQFQALVIATMGLTAAGFLFFLSFVSNPFFRLEIPPLDGLALNPLLQDPALALHPPFLYLGYVGFSVAYAFALAALIEGRVDPGWARWIRPWTLLAWASLTIGIGLGSWWAYYELGWGGWWFWDPVENVSLMPWLAGTALLHTILVVERRDTLKHWAVLLAIITFGLAVMGTFIVRSGILTSVHTFALDPSRGVYLLGLMGGIVGVGLSLYAIRAPRLTAGGVFSVVSRETALLMNTLFLCVALGTVLVGTLYPLVLEGVSGQRITVGPPFFNMTFVPLMLGLMVLVAPGAMLSWRKANMDKVGQKIWPAVILSAFPAIGLAWWKDGIPVLALLAIGIGLWTITGTMADLVDRIRLLKVPMRETARRLGHLPISVIGSATAHIGLGIATLGMAGSAFSVETVSLLRPGDAIQIAGHEIAFKHIEQIQGPNYTAEQAELHVRRRNHRPEILTPQRRWYPAANMATTEAAIHGRFWGDIYAVLGEGEGDGQDAQDDNAHIFHIYFNPLVSWIWAGCGIMALGGGVSLLDRRRRIGLNGRRK